MVCNPTQSGSACAKSAYDRPRRAAKRCFSACPRTWLKLVLIGICIGLTASWGLTRLMASQLFGISATDPLTFAGVAIALAFVALLACYIPARRAARMKSHGCVT